MKKYCVFLLMVFVFKATATIEIQPGDLLSISVYKNPDLTIENYVDDNGMLKFPLVGELELSDQSVVDAAKIIEQKLIEGAYVKDPEVIVKVLSSRARSISVLGHVRVPGKYQLNIGNETVVDFIALAGGLSASASETLVLIKSLNGETKKIEINIVDLFLKNDISGFNKDVLVVSPSDIIYVPEAPSFYIFGEVNRPGEYKLKQDLNILQALTLGGGIGPRGTMNGLIIKRRDSKGNITEIEASVTDQVLEDDVVFVKESFF